MRSLYNLKTSTYYRNTLLVISALTKPIQSFAFSGSKYFFWLLSFFLMISCSSLRSEVFEYNLSPDKNTDEHMKIKLLGSLGMKSTRFNNLPVTELSGIAWDNDEQILYAVSDEGLLYHLRLTIKDNHLEDMKVIYATRLKNKSCEHLKGKYSDAEGLSLTGGNNGKKGDTELIISFENKPRIARYNTRGKFIKYVHLPKKLRKRKHYRHKNKGLESVTEHPTYGTLTAAEFPLIQDNIKYQTVYSSTGKKWHFPASGPKKSAITGLETLPNGDLLVLERAWINPFTPITINLRQLQLNKCDDNNECQTKKIASLSGTEGWSLDNFEGLAHYNKNQYLMISDDNNNSLQNTVLVLFEIKS